MDNRCNSWENKNRKRALSHKKSTLVCLHVCVCVWPQKIKSTTLTLLLIVYLWEIKVPFPVEPRERRGFLYVLFFLLPLEMFPVLYTSIIFFSVSVVSCLSLRLSHWRLFSIPVSLLCKWQRWESIEVLCCRVNQIRCYNRKWVPMHGCCALTHAHDLLPLLAK